MERLTLRRKVRYLVSRLRHLRNDHSGPSLQGRRHGGPVQIRDPGSISTHQLQVLEGTSSYHQTYVATKAEGPSLSVENPRVSPHPKKNRRATNLVLQAKRRKPRAYEDHQASQETSLSD